MTVSSRPEHAAQDAEHMKAEHTLPKIAADSLGQFTSATEHDRGADALFRTPERTLSAGKGIEGIVDTGNGTLSRMTGKNKERLMRYLAQSAEWYLTRRDGKPVAYRRFFRNRLWWSTPYGYLSPNGEWPDCYRMDDVTRVRLGTERLVISFDGHLLALPYQREVTYLDGGRGKSKVKVLQSAGSTEWAGKYVSITVLQSKSTSLEIYEATDRRARAFTTAAVRYVERELEPLLRGRTPWMPASSTKRMSRPEMCLQGTQDCGYLCGYVNPRESGYVYAIAFSKSTGRCISSRWNKDNAVEYTGWSHDPHEMFFFGLPLSVGNYDDGALQVELRFVPASGAPERCLISRSFQRSQ